MVTLLRMLGWVGLLLLFAYIFTIVLFKWVPELYKLVPGFSVSGAIAPSILEGIEVSVEQVAALPTTDGVPAVTSVQRYPDIAGTYAYNDQNGRIGIIEHGQVRELPLLDVESIIGADTFLSGNLELGLLSFAFHPDFSTPGAAGAGRIYTIHSERPSRSRAARGATYFGLDDDKPHHLSVLSEWRIDPSGGLRVAADSQRVLFVLEQPSYDHNMYCLAFNNTAKSGSEDYGKLYIGIGNGGRGSHRELKRESLFGKIVRIDPLPESGNSYGIPATNPFLSQRNYRPEVWATGFRNPQQFSWDPESGAMFVVDIGQASVEEVNLVEPGLNYGWSYFEGRARVGLDSQDQVVKPLLPLNMFSTEFPVAEYDHRYGKAIAGGIVYRGKRIPELYGAYVFGDIVSGRMFYFDAEDIKRGDHKRVFELKFRRRDADTRMSSLVESERVDLRLSVDENGEILLLNKRDGVIRRLEPLAR